MPKENFAWKANDDLVAAYLTAGERAAVGTWQTSDEFVFEFHGGHTTGNPIYIRPVGNEDTKNLPKFDTRNCSATMYGSLKEFSNGEKLAIALKNPGQTDLLRIVANEWTRLQLLALRYWSSEPVVNNRKTAMDLWAEEETKDPPIKTSEISRSELRKILGF